MDIDHTTHGASKMNLEFLNAVKAMLISYANENGINLAEEFESVDAWKEYVIAFCIKACMDVAGLSLEDSYNFVMGNNAYQELADSVWETLNAA